MKNHYITAVIQSLQTGGDVKAVLSGLEEALQKKGHTKLYGGILRGVYQQLQSAGETSTRVTVANEKDLTALKSAIQKAIKEIDAQEAYETTIDDSLIGGFVVSDNKAVIDKSYKSILTKLYRSITN